MNNKIRILKIKESSLYENEKKGSNFQSLNLSSKYKSKN